MTAIKNTSSDRERALLALVATRFVAVRELDSADIDVSVVAGGVVTLQGWVDEHHTGMCAEQAAAGVEGVVAVRNLLRIRPEWGEERRPLETEFGSSEHATHSTSPRWSLIESL
jgi:hypothetical protein